MSSGFVKTSVLEIGEEGSFHGGEKRIESDDVKKQEYRNQQQSARPLYEQLEDEKEKKQAQYDAVTKAMFAPTKALDEEDAEHYNDVQDRKRNDFLLAKMQEDADLDSFKYARLSRTVHIDGTESTPDDIQESQSTAALPKHKKEAVVSTKIKKVKRKVVSGDNKGDVAVKVAKKVEVEPNPLSLLGNYDSDSD